MKKSLLGISLFTITTLYFLLAAVIILISLLTGFSALIGISISIIILIIQFLISPFITDLCMKWFYKANFDVEMPKYLQDFITETCNNHQMKYPKIGYIDDGAPNAFTYGHTKNDARVVLTRGIFDLLTEEEVKSVVAHELGHASHYDMLFMTVAQLVPLVLYAIIEMLHNSNHKSRDKNNNEVLISSIIYVLYIISNYIVLWLSRTREYYADSFAVEETKNPNALASALVKIGYGLAIQSSTSKVSKSNALGIFDSKTSKSLIVSSYENGIISRDNIKQAMKWEQWNPWAKWYELNSTHPLISERLLAISQRSPEFNQEPFIVFDLQKPESYVDDFLLDAIIALLPMALAIIGSITIFVSILFEHFSFLMIGIFILLITGSSYLRLKRSYSSKPFEAKTVKDLLSEVKVSHIKSIPCTLEGKVIGRGNPGCILNEDFVIQDQTGIIFLDYNQPIMIINKIFALFKSPEYFDKIIKVNGWYRRSPVPYVEIRTMEIDGKVKKIYTYDVAISIHIILMLIGLFVVVLSFL